MPPKYTEEILQLFRARPKLRYIAPEPPHVPKMLTGVSSVLEAVKQVQFEETDNSVPLPLNEARIRRRQLKMEANDKRIQILREQYKPQENPNATENAYNTLFIGKVAENVEEGEIRYEMGVFGPIKTVKFVQDTITGKRRPYCFVEYENPASLRNAMAQGSKLYLHNKKVIVDVERARTVNEWYPRRLGGGEGGVSRRFLKKKELQQALMCTKKKKRTGRMFGIRYRGSLADYSRKREQRLGIEHSRSRGNRY